MAIDGHHGSKRRRGLAGKERAERRFGLRLAVATMVS
jgi:hypothetical protein